MVPNSSPKQPKNFHLRCLGDVFRRPLNSTHTLIDFAHKKNPEEEHFTIFLHKVLTFLRLTRAQAPQRMSPAEKKGVKPQYTAEQTALYIVRDLFSLSVSSLMCKKHKIKHSFKQGWDTYL